MPVNKSHSIRVLMFGWEFPPYISGGLGTACYGLTRSMAELYASITFVVPRTSDKQQHQHLNLIGCNQVMPLDEYEKTKTTDTEVSWLDIIPFKTCLSPYMNNEEYLTKLSHRRKGSTSTLIDDETMIDISDQYGENLVNEVLRYANVGRRLGIRNEFDVIHAHDWMCYLAGVEAKQVNGRPLICHVHATEFDRSGDTPNPDIYNIEQHGLQQADLVITVSHRTKATIHQHYGIPFEKIRVVHNGVIPDKKLQNLEIRHAYKDKLVLFLGRVTMQKGPEYFIEAARIVLKTLPDVRFVMAGSGDKLPAMVDRVAQLRLQDRFHFTGFLQGISTEEMFAMSDVFVMPSVSEPFGLTPIEAMKFNTPTIISKQSGVSEILKNTVKIDFWDVNKLAGAIIKILTDDHTAKALSESGLKEVNTMSWDKAAQQIIAYYKETL